MFSSAHAPIPNEVIASGILPCLPLNDLNVFRQVCKHARSLSDDGPALSQRIKNLYGDKVIGDVRCREKFIIWYLFHKGMHYLNGYTETELSKILKRACDYFKMTKAQIKAFGAFHETEQPAIDYMQGFILIIAEGYDKHKNIEQRQADIQKGLKLLEAAADKKYDKAMLMLAAIYSPRIAALPIPGFYNLITDSLRPHLKDHKKGSQWLDLAYKTNSQLAAFTYACSIHPLLCISAEANAQKAEAIVAKLSSEDMSTATLFLATLAEYPLRSIQHLDEKMFLGPLSFYELASQQGNLDATLTMVEFHSNGTINGLQIRVPHAGDEFAAIKFLETAYEQGSNYAAFHLGILHLTGSLSLTNHREIFRRNDFDFPPVYTSTPQLVQSKTDFEAAIKCFEQGALAIRDVDFFHAIKCAQQLAYYYLNKNDLRNAFKWFQQGAGFGDYVCLMESGYLRLHHHAELQLVNNHALTDQLFEEAFLILKDATTMETEQNPNNFVADFFSAPKRNAQTTHRQLNLQQYIKWKIRAARDESWDAILDLERLFDSLKNPFDLDIKNPALVTHIRLFHVEKNFSSETLIDLAARCYQAANVPVLEDPALIRKAPSESPSLF